MVEYRSGWSYKVPAQDAGDELARIQSVHGVLRAADVVNESRPDDAVLHPVFEWDNLTAAEEYRKMQARQIIRAVVVQSTPGEEPKSVYVHVDSAGGYMPMDVVASEPDLYSEAISELKAKLAGAERAVEQLLAAIENPSSKQKRAHHRVKQAGAAVRAL